MEMAFNVKYFFEKRLHQSCLFRTLVQYFNVVFEDCLSSVSIFSYGYCFSILHLRIIIIETYAAV